jgi:hypothetical protein
MALNHNDTQRLVENWQRFGRDEELLTEAARGVDDMTDEMSVEIHRAGWGRGGFSISISEPSRFGEGHIEEIGMISIAKPMEGKGLEAYEVSKSSAKGNWGPLLYDIAMEVATEEGSGIMADRRHVSPSARNVWQYYHDNRPDVKITQLDDLKNTLTRTRKDNTQQSSSKIEYREDTNGYRMPHHLDDFTASPLSKMYSSTGSPNLDKLRAVGKLEDWR